MKKILVLCSGGLDSVVLSHKLRNGAQLELIAFDYGQRHKTELDYARKCAERLGTPLHVFDLTWLGALLSGASLTDRRVRIPEGHYAEQSMRITAVPNRNPIMLSMGFAVAAASKANGVAAAFHGGDHFVYPDCRPSFVDAFAAMESRALEGLFEIALHTPFLCWTKADIVREGARLGVPFEETWSCYAGGAQHCGRCGTCVERREAFHLAGVSDPTHYVDPDYWRVACAAHGMRS